MQTTPNKKGAAMPSDSTPPASDAATLAVTRLPAGSLQERVISIANSAKHATWAGLDDEGTMPEDHMFLRGALALVHLLDASEVMSEAPMLASLLASEFTVVDNDTKVRRELLAVRLDDPGVFLQRAIMTNRRLSGLPPMIEIVPDIDEGASS